MDELTEVEALRAICTAKHKTMVDADQKCKTLRAENAKLREFVRVIADGPWRLATDLSEREAHFITLARKLLAALSFQAPEGEAHSKSEQRRIDIQQEAKGESREVIDQCIKETESMTPEEFAHMEKRLGVDRMHFDPNDYAWVNSGEATPSLIDLRNIIGGVGAINDGDTDNLAIALACYFSDRLDRPEDDETDDETGWSKWAVKKANSLMDRVVLALLVRKPAEEQKP